MFKPSSFVRALSARSVYRNRSSLVTYSCVCAYVRAPYTLPNDRHRNPHLHPHRERAHPVRARRKCV